MSNVATPGIDSILPLKESESKQEKLVLQIYKMAESIFDCENKIREVALELKYIYTSNFRHSYSNFFPIIVDISKSSGTHDLDSLSTNLEELRKYIDREYVSGNKEFVDLCHYADQLCDHLNLEIGRLAYFKKENEKIIDLDKKIFDLNTKVEGAVDNLKLSTKSLTVACKKADSIQTELVAVLSIFAAIVIAFSGGISYISSALSGMESAEFLKSTYFILLCGFVFFNVVFLLMYLVGKIIGRNIYARCETPDCACENRCNSIKRVAKRLPYVFWFNLLVIVLIGITFWMQYNRVQMG